MSQVIRIGLILLAILPASWPALAQENAISFTAVEQMASKLAAAPYKEPPSIGGDMKKLDYDHYRALRAQPETALWRESKGLFRVEFFPAGFIYEKPVAIGIVENGNVTPVDRPAAASSTSATPA